MNEKLLILDLDETLIYATEQKLEIIESFLFDKYYIYKRPLLDRFLLEMSAHFLLGIWSSADDNYVLEIVKKIKPESIKFQIVWGRSRCSLKRNYSLDNYYYEKRLNKIKKLGFKLEDIIIVDDSPEKTVNNYGNAVYIKEFTGNQSDEELIYLNHYLMSLKDAKNIRKIEKRGWRNF